MNTRPKRVWWRHWYATLESFGWQPCSPDERSRFPLYKTRLGAHLAAADLAMSCAGPVNVVREKRFSLRDPRSYQASELPR